MSHMKLVIYLVNVLLIFVEHSGKMLSVYETDSGPNPARHREAVPSAVLHVRGVWPQSGHGPFYS